MKSQDAPDKIGYLPAEILTHKKTTDYIRWLVIPLGLEPRAHTLKVYCSTN